MPGKFTFTFGNDFGWGYGIFFDGKFIEA